jgi:hypothetical protein
MMLRQSRLNQLRLNHPRNISKKPKYNQTGNAPVIYCSLCNAEMSQARSSFRIEGWEGSGRTEEEVLPVIVYVCRQCGEVEFKAEKNKK